MKPKRKTDPDGTKHQELWAKALRRGDKLSNTLRKLADKGDPNDASIKPLLKALEQVLPRLRRLAGQHAGLPDDQDERQVGRAAKAGHEPEASASGSRTLQVLRKAIVFSDRTILFASATPTTVWGGDRRPGLSIKKLGEWQAENQLAGDSLDLDGIVPQVLPLGDEPISEILGCADRFGAGGLHVREVETEFVAAAIEMVEPDMKEEPRHGRSPL